MKSFRMTVTGALAALLLTATIAAVPSFAQDKMGGKMDGSKMDDKMGGKMMHPVYVSKGMKMGYSEADAKKMGMKDKTGKPLTKMAMLPKGYKMAGKMDDKMGSKMSGDKMGGDKMGSKMAGKP